VACSRYRIRHRWLTGSLARAVTCCVSRYQAWWGFGWALIGATCGVWVKLFGLLLGTILLLQAWPNEPPLLSPKPTYIHVQKKSDLTVPPKRPALQQQNSRSAFINLEHSRPPNACSKVQQIRSKTKTPPVTNVERSAALCANARFSQLRRRT
jgi:hypothetical protein